MEAYGRWELAVVHNRAQPFRKIPNDLWRRIIRSHVLGEEDVRCAASACRFLHALACDGGDTTSGRLSQRELEMPNPANLEPRPAVGAMLQSLFTGVRESCVFCNETPCTASERTFGTLTCDHVACDVCWAVAEETTIAAADPVSIPTTDVNAASRRRIACPACRGGVDRGFDPFVPVQPTVDAIVSDAIVEMTVGGGGRVEVRITPVAMAPWIRLRDRMRRLMARALLDPSNAIRSRIDTMWFIVDAACEQLEVGIEDMRLRREDSDAEYSAWFNAEEAWRYRHERGRERERWDQDDEEPMYSLDDDI